MGIYRRIVEMSIWSDCLFSCYWYCSLYLQKLKT